MQSTKSEPEPSLSAPQSKAITGGGDTGNSKDGNTNNNSNNKSNDGDRSNQKEHGGSSNRSRSRGLRGFRRRSRSPINRSREDRFSGKTHLRVYVANIPFDVKWGELKDLFREKVGKVRFCQLFENEDGKPRGCGLVEFEDAASAQKAIEVLNRYNFKGRELVVKEDLDIERDRFGRLLFGRERNSRDRERRRTSRSSDRGDYRDDHYSNGANHPPHSGDQFNTYGLSPQFLDSLGIKGPLNNRVFVANLDYKVSERKLEDIFALAGKIIKVRLYYDQDGKSKGFGVVEFEHPVEAVQAISMFNNQKLYDRILSVRLDKFDYEDFGDDGLPAKLPRGLEGIGKGLGIGGKPLNIAKSTVSQQMPVASPMPTPPVVPQPQANVTPQAATAALSVLSNLASLQNLPSLTQSLAQLSNTIAAPNNSMAAGPAPNLGGGYSAGSDLSAAAVQPPPPQTAPSVTNPGYTPNYSAAVPLPSSSSLAHGNGATQTAYGSGQMMGPSNYGSPPSNMNQVPASSIYSTSSQAGGTISSYSTYDKRNEPYCPPTNGIDTIFIRNLPINFSWQNLRDRFNEVGEVRFAEIKGHGTALVRFATDRDAQRAVELMHGLRIENRAIDVSFYY